MDKRDILAEAWDAYFADCEQNCYSPVQPEARPYVSKNYVYFRNINGALGRYNIKTKQIERDYKDLGY